MSIRTQLLKELKETLQISDFTDDSNVHFEPYIPDEDDDPQEVFYADGVKVVIEWEFYNIFITGLSPDEINYLKGVE